VSAPAPLTHAAERTELLGLLARHVCADEREADSRARIQKLLETGKDPWSRAHFVPGHLTASAIIVDEPRARTLLIFHAKLQLWLQPGGHFEAGEFAPSVAAQREVREETLLEPRLPTGVPPLWDVDVHNIPARKADPLHEHHDLRLLVLADPGREQVGDGVTQAQWFSPDECAKLSLDPGLKRALNKLPGWRI